MLTLKRICACGSCVPYWGAELHGENFFDASLMEELEAIKPINLNW
jgi:hypothetical protein